jgi:hypothetical protein
MSSVRKPAASRRGADALQIHEDLRFQQRNWLVQRVGWCALAILLVAGLTGLLGPGFLSRTTRSDGRGFEIAYERFVRHNARTDLAFRVAPQVLGSDQARLVISRGYLAANRLRRIEPEPGSTRSLGEYVEYSFDAQAGEPFAVRFTAEPDELGKHSVSIRLNGGPEITLVQFTYP